jgi:hypothetical protein
MDWFGGETEATWLNSAFPELLPCGAHCCPQQPLRNLRAALVLPPQPLILTTILQPSQLWSRTKGHFTCTKCTCGTFIVSLAGQTHAILYTSCHLDVVWARWLGRREWKNHRWRTSPGFLAQQLAEYRLRALKCEMSPDDTPLPKPPHRCPRKVRKGQRWAEGPTKWALGEELVKSLENAISWGGAGWWKKQGFGA